MKEIWFVCSYKTLDTFEVKKIPDRNCPDDQAFIVPQGMTYERACEEVHRRNAELERRYRYMEKARNWVVHNLRRIK